MRRASSTLALAAVAAAGLLAVASVASGDTKADQALAAAVRRGQELWAKAWAPGGKTCATCHGGGPNKMTATRLKQYPKYDKAAGRIASAQQKLNAMIVSQSKGVALELGSDDLNALEAYVSSLR